MNETVRFVGDGGLVVADTEDIALDAMELIEVEYEELLRYSPLTKRWLRTHPSSMTCFRAI